MSFESVIQSHFQSALEEAQFVKKTHCWLSELGFSAENTIALVACCRDELTSSLVARVEDTWGEAFSLASLAGFIFAGVTGLQAAFSHAPTLEGRNRYVVFAMPHIGLNADGVIGKCRRPGQAHDSSACGALVGALGQLGKPAPADPDNIEMGLIYQRLTESAPQDLVGLTKLTHELILTDLERLIGKTINSAETDYAILTGIQIHTDVGQPHLVWPQTMRAVVNGQQVEGSIGAG